MDAEQWSQNSLKQRGAHSCTARIAERKAGGVIMKSYMTLMLLLNSILAVSTAYDHHVD